jgi:hypothetical protein
MSTVVVDAATKARLLANGEVVEVRGEGGELIGRFYAEPDLPPPELLAEMELTAEEYRRAFALDAKSHTTAQVLAHLRSLK